MPKKSKSSISEKHYIDHAEACAAQTTLTAYGKIIKDGEVPPNTAGILHPRGLDEPLHESMVFGVAMGGRCHILPGPVQVWLPMPDGPADGCDWDPGEYVAWKNLPKDWNTMHSQSRIGTLSALLAVQPKAALTSVIGVEDRVIGIVRAWADMSSDPNGSDQLQVLWASSHPGGSFSDGARLLAQRVNNAFGSGFKASDFDPPDKIKTVDDLVDAIP